MSLGSFTADDLFQWLIDREDFLLLDVRNDVDFSRFQVEGPYPFEMINVPHAGQFVRINGRRYEVLGVHKNESGIQLQLTERRTTMGTLRHAPCCHLCYLKND